VSEPDSQPGARLVSFSRTELAELMMPHHANILGKVFGGTILSAVDKAAGTVAIRHAGQTCVTAAIDRMIFHGPVEIGELLQVVAQVNCVGRTSMEVGVKVCALDLRTGQQRHTNTSYVTMVCLDAAGRPTAVPPLTLETDLDRARNARALQRMADRKTHRAVTGRL
jgi:acyl-CoA hydrolase